ncbi:MAG TPA: lipid-A-disaccharide synthase [Terracidiphilus sp.]|nr:lipid-A-disaccharide synthase [Terracidiphilus sp.]
MASPIPIFVSAGEASGEHYGALLIESLTRRLAARGHSARFFGMGGPRMVSAGLQPVVRAEQMAVMGITEVVLHLPGIYLGFRRLRHAIQATPPAVAILIDFPDIHFRLARQLDALGVPVLFFVSPQLWAWKKHRIKLVQRYISEMLVIFPFEEQFYLDHNIRAEFVGHPLADLPAPAISRADFARDYQLDPADPWIALLPGSRAKEIHANLPEMLAAARLLAAGSPATRFEFLIPLAPTLTAEQRTMVQQLVTRHGGQLTVRLISAGDEGAVGRTSGAAEGAASPTAGGARAALHHARASIVASGTATVEAALIGNPFVVVYRVSPLTYAIARRVVQVPHVAMANLIAGRRVVPELIQNDFTAANIVRELASLLPDGPPRQSMMKELNGIRDRLGTVSTPQGEPRMNAIDRVASIALRHIPAAFPAPESVPS